MTFDLVIISVSERAVQCALEDGSPALWLPRRQVEWRGLLEPGEIVSATIPRWLALKHKQLVASRMSTQKVLDLEKVELDPEKASAEGSLPMSDYPQDAGKGMLGRNSKAEKPSHPSHTGVCDIAGKRYRIAAWVKTSEKTGEKYFSLSFRLEEQRTDDRRQQRQPDRGGPDWDSQIPFAPAL